MKKVFVSYVEENYDEVLRLIDVIEPFTNLVYRTKEDIKPGERWKNSIKNAIDRGSFFIACFSQEYYERNSTYMNTELTIAIDALRERHIDKAWFIPVKLNECEIPDRNIGGGETLRDLQYIELHKDWDVGVRVIASQIWNDNFKLEDNTTEEFIKYSERNPYSGIVSYKIAPDGISVYVIFKGKSEPYFFPQSLHDRNKLRRFVELLKSGEGACSYFQKYLKL